MPGTSPKITAKKRALFLASLAQCGNVTEAARIAGYSKRWMLKVRETDSEFAAAWDDALDEAGDVLEQEAWRRAHDGTPEPLTSAKGLIYDAQGQPVTVRKYSDTLLIFLLKGMRPEKYRENVKVTGALRHGMLPAAQDMPALLALRARFGDRPELLDEIAIALIGDGETEAVS